MFVVFVLRVIDTVATLTETLKQKLESPSHGHLFAQQVRTYLHTCFASGHY